MMEKIGMGILILGLGTVAVMDFKTRKISNLLVLFLLITGFLFQLMQFSYAGLLHSLLGIALGFALLVIPYRLGAMGAGDVKLLAAIGAFAGPKGIVIIFLMSALLGGVYSLFEMIRHKIFLTSLKTLKTRLVFAIFAQRLPQESEISFSAKPLYIPYGVSLAFGGILYLCGGGGFGAF